MKPLSDKMPYLSAVDEKYDCIPMSDGTLVWQDEFWGTDFLWDLRVGFTLGI